MTRAGLVGGLLLVLWAGACTTPEAADAQSPPVEITVPAVAAAEPPQPPLAPLGPVERVEAAPLPVAPVIEPIVCAGPVMQGGAILCRTDPRAELTLDGKPAAVADDAGLAVIGLTRTQASPALIGFVTPLDVPVPYARRAASATVDVLKREDVVRTFKMECNKISAQSAAEKKHASESWLKKDAALRLFSAAAAPVAFVKPADGPYSSPYGAVRTYVPTTGDCEASTSVHNGLDIAIATGTDIRAPMAGTVILADPNLYYEGGCVFLDHGRGLVSVFMHMSRIDVKPGDVLQQGQLLGLSGATGRVTGPHLHWAIKYRNVTSQDRGTDIWLDPALLLSINAAGLPAE